MILRYPSYYDKFHCIAGACEDTCCAGWEIDIDDESYAYYQSIEGEWGEKLRSYIKEYGSEDADVYERHGFLLGEDKRCPFLDNENLCEIYKKLGEDALCYVCTYTPRNFLEYGGAREVSISTSCPEAGRLLFENPDKITWIEKEIEEELDWEETEEERALAAAVLYARNQAIGQLQNRDFPIEERVIAFLQYAKEVQDCLNREEEEKIYQICASDFSKNAKKWGGIYRTESTAAQCYDYFLQRIRSYTSIASINEEWETYLEKLQSRYINSPDGIVRYEEDTGKLRQLFLTQSREYEQEHLIVYYAFLCLARCVDDYDFLGKAKFITASFLMIRDMNMVCMAEKNGQFMTEDFQRTARIYAKEVEHSEENLEALSEDCLFEEAYDLDSLCKSLQL